MRRRRTAGTMSLDSLLDTVTNVVGFLVIVLAVVQLNVAHAGREGAPGPDGDGREVQELQKELQELRARLAALLQQIAQKNDELAKAPGAEALQKEKSSLDKQMADLLANMEKIKEKIAQSRRDLAQLNGAIAEAAKQAAHAPPPATEELPDIKVVETYDPSRAGPKPDWAKK